MKKKLVFLFIILLMFCIGIIDGQAEGNNGWGYLYEVEGPSLKYIIEGVDLDIYEIEKIENEDGSFSKKIHLDTLPLSTEDFSVNPTSIRGQKANNKVDNITYIDTNLNLTREQLGSILFDNIIQNEEYKDKDLMIDVSLKYRWTYLPTYKNYYNYNFINNILNIFGSLVENEEEYSNELETLSINQTTKHVMNSAFYVSKEEYNSLEGNEDEYDDNEEEYDDEEEPEVSNASTDLEIDSYDENKEFIYFTTISDDTSYAQMYNFAILTNKEYNNTNVINALDLDNEDLLVMFHDIDNIDYLINERKTSYESLEEKLENDVKDLVGEKEVEVPNTLGKISIPLLISSVMLVLLGIGIVIVVTKQFIKVGNNS